MGNRYVLTGCQTATETELRCSACRQWKPDEAFSRSSSHQATARRFRSAECKPCQADRRRAARARERARTRHGAGVELCTRSLCTEAADGVLTYGKWLREIPLSIEGRRSMDETGRTPLCADCLSLATGCRHLVPA